MDSRPSETCFGGSRMILHALWKKYFFLLQKSSMVFLLPLPTPPPPLVWQKTIKIRVFFGTLPLYAWRYIRFCTHSTYIIQCKLSAFIFWDMCRIVYYSFARLIALTLYRRFGGKYIAYTYILNVYSEARTHDNVHFLHLYPEICVGLCIIPLLGSLV